MEDILEEKICVFCLNRCKYCMKYIEKLEKDVITYKCENYIYNQRPTPYIEFDYERSNDENYNTINSKKQKKQSAINKKSKNKKNDVNTI